MTTFRVPVQIVPRAGILDPQGTAVAGALLRRSCLIARSLGFDGVRDVHVGRFITVDVDAATEGDAERTVRDMCERLLANPVIEDFRIEEVRSA